MKNQLMIVVISVCTIAATHGIADKTQEQIIKRTPAIAKLLEKGIVGEANNGYLAFVGTSREGENLVKAENADRKKVYIRIASDTMTSVEAVGKRRAKRIASTVKPGTYIQNSDGTWEKK